MDFQDVLHVWRLVTVYLALLGVYLILLGVAVAALLSALNNEQRASAQLTRIMPG